MKPFLLVALIFAGVLFGPALFDKVGENDKRSAALEGCREYGEQFLRHPVEAEWVIEESSIDGIETELQGHIVAPNSFGVRSRLEFRCNWTEGLSSLTEFELDGKRQDPMGRILDRAR